MELMKEIEFELEGVSDLIMDKWADAEVKCKTKEDYARQAESKIYTNEKGELVIPANAIKAALREASSELVGIKKGKAMRQIIRACLFIDDHLPLGKKKHDGIREDVVSRTEGKKITRVVAYRPFVKKGWKANGRLTYIPEGNLSPEFIKQAMELAGFKYGLLGYRPEYGRFIVKKFENGH